MRKTLLAAGLTLAVLGGIGAAEAQVSVGVTYNSGGYHHHHGGHYWWHGRWYGYRPVGYYYVAPPQPYYETGYYSDRPYYRSHYQARCHYRHHRCHY